jgi:hypothetical protein
VRLAFDVFPASTPLTGRLVRLTTDQLKKGSGFRVELYGVGSGRLVINQYQPEATAANLAQDNYVQVFDLDLSDVIPLGGFFLAKGDFKLLSPLGQGDQMLSFGGPGALSYFGRCVLDKVNYVHLGDDLHFGPRTDGLWHWYNDQWGDIIKRLIDEGQDPDRPAAGQGIPDLTYDFTSSLDSASVAWDTFSGENTLPIGVNYIDALDQAAKAGLTPVMSGLLLLQLYQGFYGIDRTTTAFASGKVLFIDDEGAAGANIVEDLMRRFQPSLQLSRVLVKGDSALPADMVARTAGAYNVAREGFLQFGTSHSPEVLADAGDKALALRSDNADAPVFRHLPGLDGLSGLYTPFPTEVVGQDYLVGLSGSSLKVSSQGTGSFEKARACDGSHLTHWSAEITQGVLEEWWAADLSVAQAIEAYRVLQAEYVGGVYVGTFQANQAATEIRIYGSNSGAAWSWLPTGKIVADPAANGWTLVHTDTSGVGDTGEVSFSATETYRYWLFRAAAGPAAGVGNGWDIGAVELRDTVPVTDTYWVGDLATIHTGTETGDYNYRDLRVYAIEWVMDDQGNWWPKPELGGITAPGSSIGAPQGGGSSGGTTVLSGGGDVAPPPPPALKKELTNKSGGAVTNGDVVVIDPDNDEAFDTTAIAGETRLVGIAQADIASDAKGPVALSGYVELVTVAASVTRSHYGFTSTTVKKASGAASRAAGAFCEFLKGGAEPSAILFGPPDSAGTSSGAVELPHLLALHRVLILANRGDVKNDGDTGDSYPEDTLEGDLQSMLKGCDGVQIDAGFSSEGTPHAMHDTTVDRTTDGTGTIASKTDAQIAALNIDGGVGHNATRHGTTLKVPTIASIIEALKPYDPIYEFELKSGTATQMANFIVAQGIVERSIIVVGTTADVDTIKAIDPRINVMMNQGTAGEGYATVGWLSWDYNAVTSLAAVTATAPQRPHSYIPIAEISTADEVAVLAAMIERGIRSWETYDPTTALRLRNQLLSGAAGHYSDAGGHWEPGTNADLAAPEVMFLATDGTVAMVWVED